MSPLEIAEFAVIAGVAYTCGIFTVLRKENRQYPVVERCRRRNCHVVIRGNDQEAVAKIRADHERKCSSE